MRKLIKKSLAFCLVAMLVLSAFVGTFAVSAEEATVKAETITVEAGTTEVTVPVTINVTNGFYAAYIQVQSEFGALTAVSVPDDADYNVTADDYTAVDLATGKTLVMSIYGDDLRNDLTTATINYTFTAETAPEAGTYAVTITLPEVPAADWAESAVALTAENGAVVVEGVAVVDVADYLSDVALTYIVEGQQVTGKVDYTKNEGKALAEAVQGLGGTITYLGIAMTTDGTDPTTSETAFLQGNAVTSSIWNKLLAGNQGYNASLYYYGMNFSQIVDTNVRFAAIVKYTVNLETVTVYGAEASGNLYEYLLAQSDEASLALINAITLNDAANSADVVTGTTDLTEDYGPTFTASYDLKTVKSTGKIAYSKDQGRALAEYVQSQGGTITYLGIAMTTDGTDPTTSETAFLQGNAVTSSIWNKLLAGNQAYNASLYYHGMNIAQFGSELKFAAVVTVSAGDNVFNVYSDVQTVKFIDQIAGDDSELATAYKDLYASFVG